MKGTICTSQKCEECGGVLKYDENRNGLYCKQHPHVKADGKFFVRFGAKHTKRFGNDFSAAQRHLNGLRFKTDEGTFDVRDYQKAAPLAFSNLANQYTIHREKTDISRSQLNEIKRVLSLAKEEWGPTNIKEIGEGEIEDFLFKDFGGISDKTRHNYKSVLSTFWKWVIRREKRKSGLTFPDFPEIGFTLKCPTITDMTTQVRIVDEVKRIVYDINPRIWLGVLLLSFYPKIRPGDITKIKEGNIITSSNLIIIPHPKEKKPKIVHIAPVHSELIDQHWNPRGLSDLPFFRHIKSRQGVKAGESFGCNLLNKWWKKAASNLGVEGVTLYPGTKHTTVTALGEVLTPEQIKRGGTGHVSKAFERYLVPSKNESEVVTDELLKLKAKAQGKILDFKKKQAENE